jgi:hypothetical protein
VLAPEFELVNEVSVANWVNLVRHTAANGFFVPAPDRAAFYVNEFDSTVVRTAAAVNDLDFKYDAELPVVADHAGLVQHLNLVLAAGQLSSATCNKIAAALRANFRTINTNSPLADRLQLMSWALTAVLSAPEYLVQKRRSPKAKR